MCTTESVSPYGETIPADFDPARDGGWDDYGFDDLTGGERYRGRAEILDAVRAGETVSRLDVVRDYYSDDLDGGELTEDQREAVREWVDALESGDIPQGRGKMREGDRRCCLAVASETNAARVGGVTFAPSSVDDTYIDDTYTYEYEGRRNSSVLPPGLGNLFGLGWSDNPILFRPSYPDRVVRGDDPEVKASALNDRWRLTFREIAEVLRDYYRDDQVWV